jgi:hypothetical protein
MTFEVCNHQRVIARCLAGRKASGSVSRPHATKVHMSLNTILLHCYFHLGPKWSWLVSI